MTQDEIIRMAWEAGFDNASGIYYGELERFAALVAAHERASMWCDAEFARQQEREACAKVCDIYAIDEGGFVSQSCAAAIRARSEK